MSIAVFLGLALLTAGWILAPLWQARGKAKRAGCGPAPAVHRVCPACGQGYEPGDRFCVRCGAALGGAETE